MPGRYGSGSLISRLVPERLGLPYGQAAMSITVTTPFGPFVIGPGAAIQANSDLLGLANPPYHWTFDFTDTDNTFNFRQTSVVTNTATNTTITVFWIDQDTPAALLTTVHPKEGQSVKLTTTVTNDQGQLLDGPMVTNPQWLPLTWLHNDMFRWAEYLKGQLSGGSANDKIDLIYDAVYQRFPNG